MRSQADPEIKRDEEYGVMQRNVLLTSNRSQRRNGIPLEETTLDQVPRAGALFTNRLRGSRKKKGRERLSYVLEKKSS